MAAMSAMQWFNPPAAWNETAGSITVTTARQTDFWQVTHYGFIRDSGHFYYQTVTGDFTVQVRIAGQYTDLYDQAGLMIRQDEHTWIKCGIEYVHGVQHASAVITRGFSDWSVTPLPHNPAAIWLRIRREGGAVEVQYSLDGAAFTLLRLGYLSEAESLQAGLMCASPEGAGFTVEFQDFSITQP
jgi:regulation of enolase protein 1 (concanavalin A-like superfamily)